MSLNAYQRARTITENPRATERRLMVEITGELIAAREAGLTGIALAPMLFRNREVWNAFSDACASRGNGLPDALRASIISLALWVERHTSAVMSGRDSIDSLIAVNREIIDGLRMDGPR